MAPPWATGRKTVTPTKPTGTITVTAFASGFVPPILPGPVAFNLAQIALSMGRMQAMTGASAALVAARSLGMQSLVASIVDDGPGDFVPTHDVTHLADSARTGIAGDAGAGVTDLVMQAMGYAWRTHGAVLGLPRRVGDFIYHGAPGLAAGHVVMAEAKGSFAGGLVAATVDLTARDALKYQVAPHFGPTTSGLTIVHGYGIAYGAAAPSAPAATLSHTFVAEPVAVAAGAPTGKTKGGPARAVALGDYAAVFRMMQAESADALLTAATSGQSVERPRLVVVRVDRRDFYVSEIAAEALKLRYWPPGWPFLSFAGGPGVVAIDCEIADAFFNAVSKGGEPAEPIDLTPLESVGGDERGYAVQNDGLALLDARHVEW